MAQTGGNRWFDDEKKRREEEAAQKKAQQIEERRAAASRAQEKWTQVKAQSKSNAQSTAPSASAMKAGKSDRSMTKAKVDASLTGYEKKNEGDNDMAKVAGMHRQESAVYSDMSYDEAMGFATRIVYDDERDAFLTKWRKAAGKKGNKAYMESVPTMDEMRTAINSQTTGGIYQKAKESYSEGVQESFKNDVAAQKAVNTLKGITDVNGDAVNMNTADMPEIVRAIRTTASEQKRNKYVSALKTLTQTKGSRFYGLEFDSTQAKKFIDSAALTQENYKERTENYDRLFNPLEGNEEANAQAYAQEAQRIEESGDSDYVKRQMKAALNEAWENQTGKSIGEESQTAQESAPAQQSATEPQEAPAAQSAQEQPPEPQEENGDGEQQEKETQGPRQRSVPTYADALADEDFAKYYAARYGSIDLTRDPIRAAAYISTGNANQLTRKTQEAFNELIRTSAAARAVTGYSYQDAAAMGEEDAQNEDPFAVAKTNAAMFDALNGDTTFVLGSTLAYYLNMARSDSFPQMLRDDMEGAIMEIGVAAEEAYENGELVFDKREKNLYDAYIEANPGVLEQVRGVVRTVDEIEKEAKRQEELSAQEAEKSAQELLAQHREQVESGVYTQEAYEHVLEEAPEVSAWSAGRDKTYKVLHREIYDEWMDDAQGGWYEKATSAYLKKSGLPDDMNTEEAESYKALLGRCMEDVLLSDLRVAQTLGYESLDALYSKWGGMDVEKMHARAEAAMRRLSASVSEEDVQTINYIGTGEGVGWMTAIGKGAEHGAVSAAGGMLETIWALGTIPKEGAPIAAHNMRVAYTQAYNPALAATMYRHDMYAYAESAPSKEQGDAIRAYLDAGYDPFQIGIDPGETFIMNAAKTANDRANALGMWAQENLNKAKGTAFEVSSATTGTLTMQAVATVGSAATGNAFLGMMMGYGMPTAAQEMREQMSDGRDRKGALVMGLAHGASDALANMASFARYQEKLSGLVGLSSLSAIGAQNAGDIGATRTILGMAKAFGKAFLGGAADTLADEVVSDPIKETLGWQVIGGATEAALDGAGMLGVICRGMGNIDIAQTAQEVLGNAWQNTLCTLPLAVLGGLGDVFKVARRYATELATTGSADAAKKTMEAIGEALESEENQAAFKKAMHEAQVGVEIVYQAMTNEEVGADVDAARAASEQEQAHAAEDAASEKRMEAAKSAYIEAKSSGDIDAANRAAQDYTKARQGHNEHQREQKQKEQEAQEAYAQGMSKAAAAAEAAVAQQEEGAGESAEVETRNRENKNIAALDAEEFLAERYPNASEEQRQAVYAEFAQIADAEQETQSNADEGKITKASAEFASRIARKFGVKIQFGELGKAQGAYNRDTDTIMLSTNATQGDVIRSTMIHELTHRVETSGEYDNLSNALLALKYGENSAQLDADVRSIMGRYAAYYAQQGRREAFTEADARRELVADAAAEIIGGNEEMITRLTAEKPGVARRILNTIKSFIDKLRGVRDPEMENLRRVEALFEKALKTSGEGQGEQYSLVGRTENGEGIYTSNFNKNTPRKVKINRFIDLWQNIWSKKPFDLEIVGADGNTRTVTANFNPDYDPENKRMTDLGKVLHSSNGSSGDRTITLNLADDLPDIASGSSYDDSQNESGKISPTHDGVKEWHYFSNDFVYRDESGDKPMTLWLDLKEKEDGGWVYQMYAKKRKKGDSSQPREISSARREESPSNISIADVSADVNTNPMQNQQLSLPSQNLLRQEIAAWRGTRQSEGTKRERQFAAQTAQRSEAMPDWLKQELFDNEQQRYYDADNNNAQLMRAWERIQQGGYDAERDRLLATENFTTEDNAEANVIMAMAFRNGDVNTALEMAHRYNMEGTKQAQALQSRKLFSRMTPTGARAWAAGKVESELGEHIRTHKKQRQDVREKAKRVENQISDMQSGDPVALLGSGQATLTRENSKWGVPINEQQQALIDEYKLGDVKRPGLFYNRATRKQRMLEAILATPNPLEMTGNGLNLIERLEYIKAGEAVITNADLDYIGQNLSLYAASDADTQQSRDGDLALSRAYEAYGNITPASKREKARTWRYVSMLFSVPSALRNVIGNAAQGTLNATADTIATGLDAIVSTITGERTRASLTMSERAKGWQSFAEETKNTFRDYFVDKSVTAKGAGRFDLNQRGRVFESQVAETMRNVESFLMSVGDRNVWKKAYVNSMAEQMRVAEKNGETFDYDAAVERAEAEANYATFNEDSAVRDALAQVKRTPVFGDFLDFVMPFTGVPTNIVKRMWQFSPAGLASAAINHAYRGVYGQDFNQLDFVNSMSRGLTGTAMFAIGYALMSAGMIELGTGDEDDTKVYNLEAAQGKQYSPFIRIGDEYMSLSTFAPAVSALVMGATAYDLFREEEDKGMALYNASLSMMDQFFDASYMSGLQDIFSGTGSFTENAATSLINSMVSQNVPAMMGQIATAMDPYVRDTKDKNAIIQALKNGLIAKVPGVREAFLNEKTDITGAPIKSKEGIRNFIDPFTTTQANDDPALNELLRIRDATGESGHIPTFFVPNSGKVTISAAVSKKFRLDRDAGENKLILDADQRNRYNKLYGQTVFDGGNGVQGIRPLMESIRYQRASDKEKAEMLSDVIADAKEYIQKQICIDLGL